MTDEDNSFNDFERGWSKLKHRFSSLVEKIKQKKVKETARRKEIQERRKKKKTASSRVAVTSARQKATGRTARLPTGSRGKKSGSSYLGDDTVLLDRKRRLMEQEGHRQLAKVHAREHAEPTESAAQEGELQNSILQHPALDSQKFDGTDPRLNPEPPLNTEARREFDNERREQEMEKQLRLGNMPKFSSAPTPRPGG